MFGYLAYYFCCFRANAAVRDRLCKWRAVNSKIVYAGLHICSLAALVAVVGVEQCKVLLTADSKSLADRADDILKVLWQAVLLHSPVVVPVAHSFHSRDSRHKDSPKCARR